jgi:NADH-quinone oxidoreductase subunit B
MAPRWIGMGLIMGLEEKLPSGFVLTTVEKLAGYMRKNSLWPATFGLACCAIEMMAVGSAPKHDISRFGMERFSASPRQADLMIVAGRVSNKMAPVLRQIYDQMAAPKWVLAMGACASSGGMFNNYAIVQGVDHVVPVDIYLPGCPPRPEMLMDAILKLHSSIYDEKLGPNREAVIKSVEEAAMNALPTHQMKGLLA